MWFKRSVATKYSLLGSEEEKLSTKKQLYLPYFNRSTIQQLAFIFCVLLNIGLIITLLGHDKLGIKGFKSCQVSDLPGFDTELCKWTHWDDESNAKTQFSDSARATIKTEERTFTGGFHFDDGGNMVMNHHPEEIKYVGRPSPEIDHAWKQLLEGTFSFHL